MMYYKKIETIILSQAEKSPLSLFIIQSTTQEGTTLLVGQNDVATDALTVHAIRGLEDPNDGHDGEGESGPVDEAARIRDNQFLERESDI